MINITGESREAAKLCIGDNMEWRQSIQGNQLVGPACLLKHLSVCQGGSPSSVFLSGSQRLCCAERFAIPCALPRLPPQCPCPLLMSPATARWSSTTLLIALLPKGGCKQPTKFSTEILFMKIFLHAPLCSLRAAVLSFLGRKPIKLPFCGIAIATLAQCQWPRFPSAPSFSTDSSDFNAPWTKSLHAETALGGEKKSFHQG